MDFKTNDITPLIELIQRLRGINGCPWDRKQTPSSLMTYLIEEVYELADAIENGNIEAICEELGDVLFQVLFISQIFQERRQFSIKDVSNRTTDKMVRRHPHVFGAEKTESTDKIRLRWHQIKKEEHGHAHLDSVLDSIPASLPALMRAYRISERAARTGFDWDDMDGVIQKAQEEWAEFKSELKGRVDADQNPDSVSLEFGDVLFTLTNVARFARIHPERAMTQSIQKFEKRFRLMEKKVKNSGRELEAVSREELDQLWETVKSETGE